MDDPFLEWRARARLALRVALAVAGVLAFTLGGTLGQGAGVLGLACLLGRDDA